MGTKKYKPTSPGKRTRQVNSFDAITQTEPERSLLRSHKNKAGRNNQGKISVRHRGTGRKKHYRQVDFRRNKTDIPATIHSIEYDPFRTAFIALVHYLDGEKRYIIAPLKSKVGDKILISDSADIKPGNTLKISLIPVGTLIHNIEMQPNGGAKLVRSAGSYAVITGRQSHFVSVKLPSNEVRLIHGKCLATIGQVSNTDNRNTVVGKAGATRWSGRRPHVRGSVMNACDHPHGGGEGRAPVGQKSPRSKWGKPTLGYRTRKRPNKYVISRK